MPRAIPVYEPDQTPARRQSLDHCGRGRQLEPMDARPACDPSLEATYRVMDASPASPPTTSVSALKRPWRAALAAVPYGAFAAGSRVALICQLRLYGPAAVADWPNTLI